MKTTPERDQPDQSGQPDRPTPEGLAPARQTPDSPALNQSPTGRRVLVRFAWVSVAAAVLTIGLKTVAFALTGSVGLLSDALESVVNLMSAFMALAMLSVAARPPDEEHSYGHDKAEYFSSGVEGALIIFAAVSIGFAATRRILHPRIIDRVGTGLIISGAASLVNLIVARILLRTGQRYHSIALEADGRHLMTDVWTSVGVIAGVAAVAATGRQILDPVIAILVALNIVREGWRIIRRTTAGLMDAALPEEELSIVRAVLAGYEAQGIAFHALRTRRAGMRRFVNVHVLVPGAWTVHSGHGLLEQIESDLRERVPNAVVFTHLESLEDETSWDDVSLDRN